MDNQATSAGGAMGLPKCAHVVLAFGVMSATGTASQDQPLEEFAEQQVAFCNTSSMDAQLRDEAPQSTSAAVSELRRLTGLTWDQLARVFSVSRRTLHFWASGKQINAANKEHLKRTLIALRQADRGDAQLNREMLLNESADVLPLDLLIARKYDELLQLVGHGPGRRKIPHHPLSREAQEARRPLPPAQLVDLLQDSIHKDIGRGRAARTVKNLRRKRD